MEAHLSKFAAIEAQVVNARNVGVHKSVALTLHIPEEKAAAFFEMFGWPTMANPIPVAVARLDTDTGGSERQQANVAPEATSEPASPAGEPVPRQKTAFRDMRMPNQAGILCDTPAFQKFMAERFPKSMNAILTPEAAASCVRLYCGVKSRSEIRPRTPSGDRWQKLVDEYRAWMHQPEYA